MVNRNLCSACGACIKQCTHGVYNKEKAPTPKIIFTDGCVDGCHGCGNLCPQGAITYVGENTHWTPPHQTKAVKKTRPSKTMVCSIMVPLGFLLAIACIVTYTPRGMKFYNKTAKIPKNFTPWAVYFHTYKD